MKPSHVFVLIIIAMIVLFRIHFQYELISNDNDGTEAKKQFHCQSLHQYIKLELKDNWKKLFAKVLNI